MTDRIPPSNAAAEKAVLGSVLRWNAAFLDASQVLRSEDFYGSANREVFAAMVRLSDAGKPIDVVTVAEDLRRVGKLAEAPPAYLAGLWDSEPTGAHAAHYAGLVKDAALRRGLIHAADEIMRGAYDGCAPAAELVEAAERSVFAIADAGAGPEAVSLRRAVDEGTARVEAAAAGGLRDEGIPTGFVDLDKMLNGLHPGELTIVAARPAVGKSAFGVNLFRNAVVGAGVPAFMVSLEMSRAELADRFLACEARIDTRRLRDGKLSEEQWSRLSEAAHLLRCEKSHIDDTPCQRMFRIAANCRRLKLRHGIGMVVVDYLQLVEPESRKEPRQEQVAAISRRLKLLARECHLPVVAMAQLNRGPEERASQRPRLSDLRESGSQEQDADNVLLLHKSDVYATTLEVIVAKQRNGPTGEVSLCWQPQFLRFDNLALDYDRVYER